ncbi:hypothetical protein HOD50_00305 [Candidatus Bathyarchaeota archaeon]|nr:hypothetical protein [Candidatus Bathyarchaeota archaeon]MBT4423338.1 hypothetical protein [Candidatus Bathyarchaeota archaeon]MBT7185857.1 hypothetical protein [Candidatus Bathyarchaeota archaeon]
MKRKFGKLGFEVSTLALGGQASLQWTPDGLDPIPIILKAFKLGINYYDTSNLYDGSQLNFNQAFKLLNLIPGEKNYNKKLRESIWLTSKTGMRWGKPGWPVRENVNNWSNGENVQCAVDDVKRSLTQIFGDGEGDYPDGAYLDMVLCHTLHNTDEVDVLYEGLETPLDPNGNFGALVVLRDLRDGSNHTGMNPEKEKLIKHIGFSGHTNPPAMMDMIQRDEYGILDGMLVAINANDKQKMNMQHNVIPVAEAKGLGIIGMKVFADAAMYDKEPRYSRTPSDVYRKIGSSELPSKLLIEYVLSTPGVHTLIIGIGHIDEDQTKCQLVQNLYAAQIEPDGLSAEERKKIEEKAKAVRPNSNYFMTFDKVGLSAPRDAKLIENKITWQSAIAGDDPILHYEVFVNGELVGNVEHKPQLLKSEPFQYEMEKSQNDVLIAAVDKAGNRAESRIA